MKNLLVLTIAVLIINCQSDSGNKQSLPQKEVGLFHEITELEAFKNYERYSGVSINENFAVGLYSNKKVENNFLIALKKAKMVTDEVMYKIIDTLSVRNLQPNHFIGIGDCRLNGISNKEIIVIYEEEDHVEFYSKIKKAWRADTTKLQITEINTAGIDFMNEGYWHDEGN